MDNLALQEFYTDYDFLKENYNKTQSTKELSKIERKIGRMIYRIGEIIEVKPEITKEAKSLVVQLNELLIHVKELLEKQGETEFTTKFNNSLAIWKLKIQSQEFDFSGLSSLIFEFGKLAAHLQPSNPLIQTKLTEVETLFQSAERKILYIVNKILKLSQANEFSQEKVLKQLQQKSHYLFLLSALHEELARFSREIKDSIVVVDGIRLNNLPLIKLGQNVDETKDMIESCLNISMSNLNFHLSGVDKASVSEKCFTDVILLILPTAKPAAYQEQIQEIINTPPKISLEQYVQSFIALDLIFQMQKLENNETFTPSKLASQLLESLRKSCKY